MSAPMTFKQLCDAAVTMGEMSQGTTDYFHGLYLNSDECRDLARLRDEMVNLKAGVRGELDSIARRVKHLGASLE